MREASTQESRRATSSFPRYGSGHGGLPAETYTGALEGEEVARLGKACKQRE